jgi:hypothetical protein
VNYTRNLAYSAELIGAVDATRRSEPNHYANRRPSLREITRAEYPAFPFLATIVQLTSELPEELLNLSGEIYNGYIIAISTIKEIMRVWLRSTPGHILPDDRPLKALVSIRDALANCPDEAPLRKPPNSPSSRMTILETAFG